MDATQIVRHAAAETTTGSLVDDPLLVVSVLDRGMKHASARRSLRAALAAIDRTHDATVRLLNAAGGSRPRPDQRGVLTDCLDVPMSQLPEWIAEWHANACGTLVIAADGSTLVIETTEGGSALVLSEQKSCVGMLTARERDVMRCVEDGLSNTEIARRLWIQPATVRTHLEHVFAKLGVRSRTAALSKLRGSRGEAS